jgi:pyruvate dehydrogenase E2 component (dihydrolipoamide acetyltransferase)
VADEVREAGVAVTRIGRDAPVRVLLHGFGSNSGTFQNLLPFLRGKGSLVLVDLPGHGRSGVPDYDPSPDKMAVAVAEALSPLHLDSFQLVGHSLGAMVATHVAAALAPQVSRLSLIACAGVGPELNLSFFRAFLSATAAEDLLPQLAAAYGTPPQDLSKIGRGIFAWLEKPGVRAWLGKVVESAPSFSAAIAPAIAKGIPVSALWGARDIITPVGNARSLPPEVSLDILDDAGHVPHLEAPAEVARWILTGSPSPRRDPA